MPGIPIKMIWSREEDMAHGQYHPNTHCKMVAGLDDKGEITGLHMRISGQSILAGLRPEAIRDGKDPVVFQGLNLGGPETAIGYTFPNLLVDHAMRNPHVPPGFWRGVNLNQNALYLESFIDEIAHATKQEPLALRRKLMANHPKHLAVLEAVAKHVGWDKPAPAGVFRGFAQTMGFGSYVAACAEVSVSKDGVLKIHRIVAATALIYGVKHLAFALKEVEFYAFSDKQVLHFVPTTDALRLAITLEEIFLVVFAVETVVLQFSFAIALDKNAVRTVFVHLKQDVTLVVGGEVVVNGFLIALALPGEAHFRAINHKQEVEGVDQGGFTYVVGTYQLQ
jgi:hypothetical protein